MSDKPDDLNLEAIEAEESRLRERLAKLAVFKQLARDLNISLPKSPLLATTGPVSIRAFDSGRPPDSSPDATAAVKPALDNFGAVTLTQEPPDPWRVAFDGTFKTLVDCYKGDPRSTYHGLKHNVRTNYDSTLKRLVTDVGDQHVKDWSADKIQFLYDHNWAASGKFHMGHAIIAKLRLLCTYGSVTLNDDACIRLSAILGTMRFSIPKPQNEPMTAKHAQDIRKKARELGFPSIALAQALQFEIRELRQMDVIGEWVPLSEPGPPSDITKSDEKWLRGLRWSEIDADFILRRTLTTGRKNQYRNVKIDLKRYEGVLEELKRVTHSNRNGPLVACESTGQPWTGAEFRRKWRQIADKAGVPKTVRNDIRSGIREDNDEADEDGFRLTGEDN